MSYSCALSVIVIMLWFLAYLEMIYSGWSRAVVWSTAIVAAALFVLTLVIHGVVQYVTMRSFGTSPAELLLLPSGGVIHITGPPTPAKVDIVAGLLGPVVHGGLGLGSLALASLSFASPARIPPNPEAVWIIWFGYFNLGIVALNLIPSVPLDGGLILRAAIRCMTDDPLTGELVSRRVGHVVAPLILIGGLLWLWAGQYGLGICAALISCGLMESFWSTSSTATLQQDDRTA